MEENKKSKSSLQKESSKIHNKLSKAFSSILSHENSNFETVFSKGDSFFVYHFGNGDEDDYNLINSLLSKHNVSYETMRIFPGISYAYIKIIDSSISNLKSTAEHVQMKDKNMEVYYYIENKLTSSNKDNKIRPFFFFNTSLMLNNTNLYKKSTLPNATLPQKVINEDVPGLVIIEDFITKEDEDSIIKSVENEKWNKLSNRLVQHYGYEFIYGRNEVNKNNKIGELPCFISNLIGKLEVELTKFKVNTEKSKKNNCDFFDYNHENNHTKDSKSFLDLYGNFDQLTVNKYYPGDGIPPHVDSHSPFNDIYCSISLQSGVVMTFTKKTETYNIYLKPRSAVFFTNELRFEWEHSISLRKVDIVENRIVTRQQRISLTFRKVSSRDECQCVFIDECDGFKKRMEGNKNFEIEINQNTDEPTDIEKNHVYAVYDKIAPHFSDTRYKPWPRVVSFLSSLEKGSLVGDIGCGNGKYLSCVDGISTIGTDRSGNLTRIAYEKNPNSNLFICDSLSLPIRENTLDAAISIAVIHHFSNDKLRIRAIKEIKRSVKKGGLFLIYVWALEQEKGKFKGQDNLVAWHLHNNYKDDENSSKDEIAKGIEIKEKNSVVYQRYYHVFKNGELEKLIGEIEGVKIIESYYDHENWCCICMNI